MNVEGYSNCHDDTAAVSSNLNLYLYTYSVRIIYMTYGLSWASHDHFLIASYMIIILCVVVNVHAT